MVARLACSMRAATSGASAAPRAALHARCVSSCCRRSIPAWPAETNDPLRAAATRGASSPSLPVVLQPPVTNAPKPTKNHLTGRRIGAQSSLDAGCVERRAVGVARQIHRQRDRRVGAEHELGKPLLPKAIIEPPFEGAQLALRDPIGRPCRVRLLRALWRHEVWQILQPNALAFLAVAGGAAEIVGPCAKEKQSFADAVGLDLLRVA